MSARYAVQRKSLFMYPYGFTLHKMRMMRPKGWDWVNNLAINSEFLKEAVRIRTDD